MYVWCCYFCCYYCWSLLGFFGGRCVGMFSIVDSGFLVFGMGVRFCWGFLIMVKVDLGYGMGGLFF